MRRLRAVLPALLAAQMACRMGRPIQVIDNEPDPPLLATLAMADPRAVPQLTGGFYNLEQKTWRWTAGRFRVQLQPTRSAAAAGARLVFRFTIPGAVITRVPRMTLSAKANGLALTPETYSTAGDFVYTREIPAAKLQFPPLNVEFMLDRFLKAGEADPRELGVIAVAVGLEPR